MASGSGQSPEGSAARWRLGSVSTRRIAHGVTVQPLFQLFQRKPHSVSGNAARVSHVRQRNSVTPSGSRRAVSVQLLSPLNVSTRRLLVRFPRNHTTPRRENQPPRKKRRILCKIRVRCAKKAPPRGGEKFCEILSEGLAKGKVIWYTVIREHRRREAADRKACQRPAVSCRVKEPLNTADESPRHKPYYTLFQTFSAIPGKLFGSLRRGNSRVLLATL